jgi:hypothetical protein
MVMTDTTGTTDTTAPTPATPAMDKAARRALAGEIAAQLGETDPEPAGLIARALRLLGAERVQATVARALEVEAAGGMMVPDGSRRRTPGGVFFYLLRTTIGQKDWYRIFRPQTTGHAPPGAPGAPNTLTTGQATAAAATPFAWATFSVAAMEAMSERGEATTVKLTAIGRPGKVVERGDVVLVAMRSEKAPSFPKGVPAPESPQTDYMALVGMKQWRKVAEALAANPDDKVIIEGYPTVRPDFAGITVHATSATTTGIQAGKRAAQQVATATQSD